MRMLGYILMVIGLALIAVRVLFEDLLTQIPGLTNLNTLSAVIIGGALIIVGFFLTKRKSKMRHASEEVPIYEGAGKKRRIVGYRRA